MPIPGPADAALREIDDLHNVVLVRLRTFHYSDRRDPRSIREALQEYNDKVADFVNGEHHQATR
jgi:hypothetical protein